jgi:hypothetical protein
MDQHPTSKKPNQTKASNMLALWKSGCLPHEALVRYGSPELVTQFAEAHEQKSDLDRVGDYLLWHIEHNTPPPTHPEAHRHALTKRSRQDALRVALELELVKKFENETLIPLGFLVPGSEEAHPVEIRLDIFDRRPGWSRSETIEGNGLEYVSVRIAERDVNLESKLTRPGRPSREDQILAAWDQLVSEEQISKGRPLGSHFLAVRQKIKELFPHDKRGDTGLDEKTLYAFLSPRFSELPDRF